MKVQYARFAAPHFVALRQGDSRTAFPPTRGAEKMAMRQGIDDAKLHAYAEVHGLRNRTAFRSPTDSGWGKRPTLTSA
ncbi:hypothetical protein San01_60340 [Streptomyces angustmyceticus]|uniref:Uncharacterized protein n=1 Tax=Streptomyces angustmyceticus TaxID=285578 RepID=A0A5J4LPS1_9ACTN|nr:hypothetical protein San01_60340 [Streptomyces angustmyceticus]